MLKMTKQQIFDKVATHLIKQKRFSGELNEEGHRMSCLYRGPDGTKCAIGVLISDDIGVYRWNGAPLADPDVQDALCRSGVITSRFTSSADSDDAFLFLSRLQSIHDSINPSKWPETLARFAKEKGLTMPEVAR